eukprot:182860_1
MGNETSDSSSSSALSTQNELLDTENVKSTVQSHTYYPSLSTGIYGIYCINTDSVSGQTSTILYTLNKNKQNQPDRMTIERSVDQYIPYGKFKVIIFIQYFERLYNMNIMSVILNISVLYYGKEIDCFDMNNKGPWLRLNNKHTICTSNGDAANTCYGKMKIKQIAYINAYKWTFKVINKRLAIYIGIDSNPEFKRSDFSNYFRNFKTKHNDIFCSYGSDGNIYHCISRDAYEYGEKWMKNDEIEMVIDIKQEILSYYVNGKYQGVAMYDLAFDQKVYNMAVALFYDEDAIELIDFSVHCD